MIKDVGFRIKIPLAGETVATTKAVDKQRKTLREMAKVDIPTLTKSTKKYLGEAKKGFRETGDEAQRMGKTFSSSMSDGLRGLHRLGAGIEGLKSKVLNLKTALAGTAVGIAGIWAGKKLFEGGKQALATRGRIGREFGAEAGSLQAAAALAGRRAGVSEDDAIRGLIPLREQLDAIEGGAQFRGMRKKLTDQQAKALREKNLTFGANLFARVSTLAPDLDKEQVGRTLADALTGPEGIRRLTTEFNLSRASRKVSEANEKGDVYKVLREDERKKYGVTKKGQFLEQGDLVNILLERSGITEGAAEAKRKKLDFQLKAIGATAENALAEIGAKALDKFNGGMAKGATLSEKFENALKSKQGQRVLEGVSDAVVGIANAAVGLATNLPKIGGFLSEHKTTLLALGAAFAGLKVASKLGGSLPSSTGGLGSIGLGRSPIPVYVTNAGGLGGTSGIGGKFSAAATGLEKFQAALGVASAAAGAFSLGYGIGSYLDKKFDVSGGLEKGVHLLTAKDDQLSNADQLMRNSMKSSWGDWFKGVVTGNFDDAAKKTMTKAMAEIAKHPDAYVPPPIKVEVQLGTINLDGQKIAEVAGKHMARDINNKTARGAAPRSRE